MHLAIYGLLLCLFQNGGFNHENKWTEHLYRNIRTVTSLVGWLSEQEFVPSIACTRLVRKQFLHLLISLVWFVVPALGRNATADLLRRFKLGMLLRRLGV